MTVKELKKILDDYSDIIEVKVETPENNGEVLILDVVKDKYDRIWNELRLICE